MEEAKKATANLPLEWAQNMGVKKTGCWCLAHCYGSKNIPFNRALWMATGSSPMKGCSARLSNVGMDSVGCRALQAYLHKATQTISPVGKLQRAPMMEQTGWSAMLASSSQRDGQIQPWASPHTSGVLLIFPLMYKGPAGDKVIMIWQHPLRTHRSAQAQNVRPDAWDPQTIGGPFLSDSSKSGGHLHEGFYDRHLKHLSIQKLGDLEHWK